ncbi:MAG: hypothetical protein CMJ83_18140 [Planctomycetes bacterium]|nr:hypothetical protein [Planctomycetota bacterium]
MINTLPTPTEMVAWLDRVVIGQETAKRDLATAVYSHYLALAARDAGDDDPGPRLRENILAIGPTGCGKTLMIKTLAEMLDVPVSYGVATRFSETGYVGDGVESLIANLVARAGGDLDRARRGIIYIDEIDKIARRETRGRDVSGEGVQHGLLSLIEGSPIMVKVERGEVEVDTTDLLFICTGAFSSLERIVSQRAQKERARGLGFAATAEEPDATDPAGFLGQLETEDLVTYGFIPELIGRFSVVTLVQALSEHDLETILARSEASPLLHQRKLFSIHGIELTLTKDALRLIAAEAMAKGVGARGLARVLLAHLAELRFQLPELARKGIRKIVIGRSVITDGAAPRLTRTHTTAEPAPDMVEVLRRTAFGFPDEDEGEAESQQNEAARNSQFSDTSGWTTEEIDRVLQDVKARLGFQRLGQREREWWERFENDLGECKETALRVGEELVSRDASLSEFFVACAYSGTESIQANLHFLDYYRLKKREAATAKTDHRSKRDDEGDE